MKRSSYFLVLAVFMLVVGCLLIVGQSLTLERGPLIKQTEWTIYLGILTVYAADCFAALIKGVRDLERRIEDLERPRDGNGSKVADGGAVEK